MLSAAAIQFGTGINYSTLADLYPDAGGPTTAMIGSAQTPFTTDVVSASDTARVAEMEPAAAANGGATSSRGAIMVGMLTIIALLLALGLVGNKLGGREGETGLSNLKLSGYNIAYIGLAATIFIGLAKVVFTKVNVPGVSTWVSAL